LGVGRSGSDPPIPTVYSPPPVEFTGHCTQYTDTAHSTQYTILGVGRSGSDPPIPTVYSPPPVEFTGHCTQYTVHHIGGWAGQVATLSYLQCTVHLPYTVHRALYTVLSAPYWGVGRSGSDTLIPTVYSPPPVHSTQGTVHSTQYTVLGGWAGQAATLPYQQCTVHILYSTQDNVHSTQYTILGGGHVRWQPSRTYSVQSTSRTQYTGHCTQYLVYRIRGGQVRY
jgi:hypothetical protein